MPSSLAVAMRSYWIPEIHNADAYDKSMANHLRTRDYYIIELPAGSNFKVYYNSHREAVKPYSYDMMRMFCASIETLTGISKNPIFNRGGGWIVIQLYYAAFFAAHSILRSVGYSMTKIDSHHIHGLDKRSRDYGYRTPLAVPTGFYGIKYTPRSFASEFTKESSGGGSHEIIWKELERLFKTISADAANGSFVNLRRIEQLEVQALSSALNTIISSQGGSGPWLSYIRNQVNYQQDFGIWYPYKKDAEDLVRIYDDHKDIWLNECNQIYIDVKDPVMLRFVRVCMFIISLARENVYQLSEVSERQRNIYNSRVIKMINIAFP